MSFQRKRESRIHQMTFLKNFNLKFNNQVNFLMILFNTLFKITKKLILANSFLFQIFFFLFYF